MSSKSEAPQTISPQVMSPVELGKYSSSDEIDMLSLLRFIWQVRWGLLIGCLIAIGITIVAQISQPIVKYVRISVSVDQRSSYFVSKPEDLVIRFNRVLGSHEAFQGIIDELIHQNPQYKDYFDKVGFSASTFSTLIVPPGSGPITLTSGANPYDLDLMMAIPHTGESQTWLRDLLIAVNKQIVSSNDQYRNRLKNISRETIGEIIGITSVAGASESDELNSSLSRLADAKLKLGAIISQLQKLNKSEIDYMRAMRRTEDRESSMPEPASSDILIDLAFIEAAKAHQSGRIDDTKAQQIRKELVDIKAILSETEFRLSAEYLATSQLKSSIEKFEQALRKDLETNGGLLPTLLLQEQVMQEDTTGPFKNKKWLLIAFGAAICGAMFGGGMLGTIKYLKKNWRLITQ